MQLEQNNIIKITKGDTYVRPLKLFLESEHGGLYKYELESTDTITLKIYDFEDKEVLTQQCEIEKGKAYIRIPNTVAAGVYNYKLVFRKASGETHTVIHSLVYIRKE